MAKVKVNFADTGNNLIPEGEYEAIIDKVELKDSNDKTSQYLAMQFSLTDPDYLGRKLWKNLSLKSTAGFFFKQTFEALGVEVPVNEDTKELDIDIDVDDTDGRLVDPDFEGMQVLLKVEIGKNKKTGEDQQQVTVISSEATEDDELVKEAETASAPATSKPSSNGRRKL